jgi:hypothetical protein
MFVKTFKGYEDRTSEIDGEVNSWVQAQGANIQVVDIKVALAHEPGASSGMGDLIFAVIYRAAQPVTDGPGSQLPAGFEY